MLKVESGISPEIIAQRGYWTASTAAEIPPGFAPSQYQPEMFPILVIPQWNTVGRQVAYVLRPDHPRLNDDGKPIKYESQPGGPVGFDCPPSMVHLLRDPSVPLYITEGSKKADAMASRGLLCLSLNGVYGFLYKRLVVSELDEINLVGRIVHPAFDSDVTTKKEVADALDRLASAADRRGARVEIVHLPAGDDGAKVGLDDYLAGGGSVSGLDTLTRSWEPLRRPRNMIEYANPYAEIERLRRDNAALVKTLTTPHVKDKHKIAVTRLATIGMSKSSRGQDMNDRGQVRVSARELTNDWRERKAKGERAEPTNPDGSVFLMDRDSVHGLLKELRDDLGVLDFQTVEVKKTRKANGLPYIDREFLIVPPTSIASMLEPVARYTPALPKARPYKRQEPCIYCGEVHARKVVCTGCDKTVKVLPVPAANDPNATEEQRRDLEERTAARAASVIATDEHIDIETGEILENDSIAGNFPVMERTYKASFSPTPVIYSAGNFPAMGDGLIPTEPSGLWEDPPVARKGAPCRDHGAHARYEDETKVDLKVEILSGPVQGVVTPRSSGLIQMMFDPDAPNICACGKPIPLGHKGSCSGTCHGTSFTDPVEEEVS